jgi:hypothetical protein
LDAAGGNFTPPSSGFFVRPVSSSASVLPSLMYDSSSNQITVSTSKTFVIDHPNDPERYLVHGCLEGPESGVYYRGKTRIPMDHQNVVVTLPDYTRSWYDFSVSVTPIGKPMIFCATDVLSGTFEIIGESGEYHWVVYAKRGDLTVEPFKELVNINGSGPYRWLN